MRGIVGLTLSGLGAFFVALALALHFFVTGQVSKFPLNELSKTTFTGHGISYFDFDHNQQMTDVDVQATQALQGDVEAGSSSTAVWVQFTSVQDLTNSQAVKSLSTSRRSAFDRRTGELINCCGDYVGTSTTLQQSGQGYRWPIGTQKRTYQVFNPTTLRPEPFQYQGTRPIDGKPAYQFAEHVSNRQFGTRKVPGWLVGATAAQVRVPEFITETDTVWVDPVSGIPLYEILSQTQTANYLGAVPLVLFQGTLVETPESAASTVAVASSFDLRQELLNEIGPLSGGLLGIAAIGVGVALAGRRKARDQAAVPEAPSLARHGHEPEIPQPAHAAGLPEPAYASGLPAGSRAPEPGGNGYAPELAGASYPLGLPGVDYPPGPAETSPASPATETSYALRRAEAGDASRQAETGGSPGASDSSYAPGYSRDGYWQDRPQPDRPQDLTQPLYLPGPPQSAYPQDRQQAGSARSPAQSGNTQGPPQPGLAQDRPRPVGPPQDRPQPGYLPQHRLQPSSPPEDSPLPGYPQTRPQYGYPHGRPQPGYPPQDRRQAGYPRQDRSAGYPQSRPEPVYPAPDRQQPGYGPQTRPQPAYPPQSRPQPGYPPPGRPQPGYPPQSRPQPDQDHLPQSRPQPGYQPPDRPQPDQDHLPQSRPQPGYQPHRQQPGYRPEPAPTQYPPWHAENGQQAGQGPDPDLSPEFPGRKNDGIPWILEPGADQPRVGRDGRGGRDRAPGR